MCHKLYDEKAAVYKEQLPEKDAEISITMQIDVQAFIDHKPQLPISILKEFCIYSKEKSKWIQDETKSTPRVTMMADSGAQVALDLVDDVQQDHQQPAEVPAIIPGEEVADNAAAVPSSPPPPTPTPVPSPPTTPTPIPDPPAKERPRRERKQNSMYSSDIYDLSQVGLTGHQGCSDGCATSGWFRPWED